MRFTLRPELSMKIMSVKAWPTGVMPEGGVDETQLGILENMLTYRCGVVLSFPGDPTNETDVLNAQFSLGRYIFELIKKFPGLTNVKCMGNGGVDPVDPNHYGQLKTEDSSAPGVFLDFTTADDDKVTVIDRPSEPGDLVADQLVVNDGEEDFVLSTDDYMLVARSIPGGEKINPLKFNVIIYLSTALNTPSTAFRR